MGQMIIYYEYKIRKLDIIMFPFVKWAGGKRQLLDELKARVPNQFNTYFEPFVGGGAFFLDTQYQNVVINDANEQLINCYRQIQINAQEVISEIHNLDAIICDKEEYLKIRERYNQKILNHQLDVECATLFIWLNKNCFNGLYRTNRKGLFNTPWNNKSQCESIDEENLLEIHDYLNNNNIQIACGDYQLVCQQANIGDFLFFDPPYDPVGVYGDFKRYTKEQFGEQDQRNLATCVRELANNGCYVMVTNSNTPLINELYEGFHIDVIQTKRNINSKGNRRTGEDVIITTY